MEKVLKHWLPREVMDSPPLEEFKTSWTWPRVLWSGWQPADQAKLGLSDPGGLLNPNNSVK